jgi:hypothetical protein
MLHRKGEQNDQQMCHLDLLRGDRGRGDRLETSTASFSQSNAAHLVGSWKGAVAATSPPGLEPFTSLITFTTDGTTIESRRLFVPASPLGPLLETTGHGAWGRVNEREFDVHFVFLLQGAVSGSNQARITCTCAFAWIPPVQFLQVPSKAQSKVLPETRSLLPVAPIGQPRFSCTSPSADPDQGVGSGLAGWPQAPIASV